MFRLELGKLFGGPKRKGAVMTTVLVLAFSALVCLGAARADDPWKAVESGGVVYFFFLGGENRVERYDLNRGAFLPSIPLTQPDAWPLSGGAVHSDQLYAVFGDRIVRYDLGREVQIGTIYATPSGGHVNGLVATEAHLYANAFQNFISLEAVTGNVIEEKRFLQWSRDLTLAPGLGTLFMWGQFSSPGGVAKLTIHPDGTFGESVSSEQSDHVFPAATRTFVSPDETLFADDAGQFYDTGTLEYAGSLGNAFDDIRWTPGNRPIVLRGDQLVSYSADFHETETVTLPVSAENLALAGDRAAVFSYLPGAGNEVRVDLIPLSNLAPPEPGVPGDPASLWFTPDDVLLDNDGILYLFSREHECLFRWDTGPQSYLSTIPLRPGPRFVAYLASHHKIFVAYESGAVRQIDLSVSPLAEQPFTNLASGPLLLKAIGQYLFAVEKPPPFNDFFRYAPHRVYGPDGTLIDSKLRSSFSSSYGWSEVNSKLYFYSKPTVTTLHKLESLEIDANGTFGAGLSSANFMHDPPAPIVISPDGSHVIAEGRYIYDGATLEYTRMRLPSEVVDAVWTGDGGLNTVRENRFSVTVRRHDADYEIDSFKSIPGSPVRILPLGASRLVAVTKPAFSPPSISVLDNTLTTMAPAELLTPGDFYISGYSFSRASLRWSDVNGESGYRIERREVPGDWETLAVNGEGLTTYLDSSISGFSTYEYRVVSVNGALESVPSEVISTEPLPAPAYLNVVNVTADSVELTWPDSVGEFAFFLERKVGAGPWESAGSSSGDQTTFRDSGLEAGLEYTYRVRAFNGLGHTDYSPERSVTTLPKPLPAPGYLISFHMTADRVDLAWEDVDGETGYRIERRSGAAGSWREIGTTPADVTTFSSNGLAESQIYEFRARAYTPVENSPFSPVRSVMTAFRTIAETPASLRAPVVTSTRVRLVWEDVKNEIGYTLERKTGAAGTWEVIAATLANGSTHTDTLLTPETTYVYRVKARNPIGDSAYSPEWTVTTPPPGPDRLPDGLIGLRAAGLVGDDIFGVTGNLQRIPQGSRSGKPMTWYLGFENDGELTDTLKVRGTRGNGSFRVKYFVYGGPARTTNETATVVTGTHEFADLWSGERRMGRVRVKPSRKVRGKRKLRTCVIRVSSMGDPTKQDRLKAVAKTVK